jgi:hypothetical protein
VCHRGDTPNSVERLSLRAAVPFSGSVAISAGDSEMAEHFSKEFGD